MDLSVRHPEMHTMGSSARISCTESTALTSAACPSSQRTHLSLAALYVVEVCGVGCVDVVDCPDLIYEAERSSEGSEGKGERDDGGEAHDE
jgi:hypothetical protein